MQTFASLLPFRMSQVLPKQASLYGSLHCVFRSFDPTSLFFLDTQTVLAANAAYEHTTPLTQATNQTHFPPQQPQAGIWGGAEQGKEARSSFLAGIRGRHKRKHTLGPPSCSRLGIHSQYLAMPDSEGQRALITRVQ